jgi:hypothetical protein
MHKASLADQGKTKQQHARVRGFRGSTDCLGFRLGHAHAVVGEMGITRWTLDRSAVVQLCHSNAWARQSEILILHVRWSVLHQHHWMHTQDSDLVATFGWANIWSTTSDVHATGKKLIQLGLHRSQGKQILLPIHNKCGWFKYKVILNQRHLLD